MGSIQALLLCCLICAQSSAVLATPQVESDEVLRDLVSNLKPQDVPALSQKASSGDLQSQLVLGWAYMTGAGVERDYVAAAKWLEPAVGQGSGLAACALGTVYAAKGPRQNFAKAMELYNKSAAQGQACGEFNLGMMYQLGGGMPPNAKEAVKWYERAAGRRGYHAMRAQQFLGDMYFRGAGVKKDYRQAAKWYETAEQSGLADAEVEFGLGLMYAEGMGVNKNESESDSWFLKAAEHGNAKAQLIMGIGCLEGKKYDEAAKWLTKAAEAGEPEAQGYLARMYSNGEGFKQDDAEAVKWATKAAEQGDKDALHLLGFIYCCRMPRTIPADYVASWMWFILSQRAGDKKAPEFLAMLIGETTKEQRQEAATRAEAWEREHQKPPANP